MEDSRYVWISIPAAQLENVICRKQFLSLCNTPLLIGVTLLDKWPCLFVSWPLSYNTAFHILCQYILYFLITWACTCKNNVSQSFSLDSVWCWVFWGFGFGVFLSIFLGLFDLFCPLSNKVGVGGFTTPLKLPSKLLPVFSAQFCSLLWFLCCCDYTE